MIKINLLEIPAYIRKKLEEAGVNFASDGHKDDVTSLDILNANYKFWRKDSSGEIEEIDWKAGKVDKLRYALSSLYAYLYDNGKESVAKALNKEISEISPRLESENCAKKEIEQLRGIHGRELLYEKGILLSLDSCIDPLFIAKHNFSFERSGKNIKLVYYNRGLTTWRQPWVELNIDTEGLTEIRFEGNIMSADYRIKVMYDYKDVGKKEKVIFESNKHDQTDL